MKSEPEESPNKTILRTFAILASSILLLSKITSYIILSSYRSKRLDLDFYLNAQSIFFSWMLPILIVYFIEKQKLESLGFASGRLPISIHLVLVVLVVVLPIVFLGLDRSMILQILEQILFIAFAEEVLWRGYFQKRLSDWLGSRRGILVSSILFGLGHIVSIHAVEGYLIPSNSIVTLVQTTIGGLIFGYLFYWSKSVWPGALLHLFGNVFLSRII